MALVVKKWYAGKTPNSDGNYVHIVGRQAGLFAWFLSLIGVDPTTEIEIKVNLIIFTTGSLSGREKRVIPMKSVCSAYYGYKKPWQEALVYTIILFPFFFIGLLVGPLYYFLNKQLTVAVIENSSWVGAFSFKRSVIDGQNINENSAYEIMNIIRALIELKTS